MFGYSNKTLQWILGYIFFNLFFLFYVYIIFYNQWFQVIVSVTVPLLVWEILTFGILAPDDVFEEIFGENQPTSRRYRHSPSQVPSVHAVVISSGDY